MNSTCAESSDMLENASLDTTLPTHNAIVTSTRPGTRRRWSSISLFTLASGCWTFALRAPKTRLRMSRCTRWRRFVRVHAGDFRVDPEDPPLFSYWAMLPHGPAGCR